MTNPSPILRALALAAPLLLAAGCDPGGDSDNNGTGPTATARVRAVLDGSGGVVTVTDGGVAVTGATVALNGTAAVPGATVGEYDVTLAAPVAAGGALTLDVSDGEVVVQGIGTVPEAPVITAPANATDFDPADPIEVTWTSTTDPAGFVVEAVGATTETFPVAGGGAARTHTITAGTLTNGDWTLRVRMTSLGTMSGDIEPGSSMEIGADATSAPAIKVRPHLLILGSSMGPELQNISLSRRGSVVNGATVTVNGEAATQAIPGAPYTVQLSVPVAEGGALDLDVTEGTDVYQGSGVVPEGAVVTAPADGAVVAGFDVTWTSTTDPSRWVVSLFNGVTNYEVEVAGTERSAHFAAGTVAFSETPYAIRVFSYDHGSFAGPAHSDSRMNVRNQNTVTVTIGTPLLLIEGSDMGDGVNDVQLTLGGVVVDGATVTVNGEAARQAAPGDEYHVVLAEQVAAGEPLHLSVTVGPDVYTATGTMPAGTSFTAVSFSDSLRLEWATSRDPDRFGLTVERCWSADPPVYQDLEIAGTQRSYTIPAGDIPSPGTTEYWVRLRGFVDGSFTGPVHPGSRMGIRNGSAIRVISGYC